MLAVQNMISVCTGSLATICRPARKDARTGAAKLRASYQSAASRTMKFAGRPTDDVAQVACPEGIPWIGDVVLPEADVDAAHLRQAKLIDSTEYSRVNSKCGIAPIASTPSSAARRISPSPSGKDWMPSCGNATICSVTLSLSSSRSSSSVCRAVSSGR